MTGRFKIEREAAEKLSPPKPMSEVPPEPGPAEPEILHVDTERLVLRDTFGPARRWVMLGTIILAVAPLLFWGWTWLAGRQTAEADMLRLLDEEIAAFGTDYVQNEIDAGDRTLPLIWPDRTLTLSEYIHYEISLSGGGLSGQLPALAFVVTALVLGLIGVWILWRNPGKGTLTFDRKRQAIYCIRRGRLLVQKYGTAHVVQRPWEFGWLLSDDKGMDHFVQIRLPNDAQGALDITAGDRLLGRVTAFMENGPTAISDAPTGAGPAAEKVLGRVDARLGDMTRQRS